MAQSMSRALARVKGELGALLTDDQVHETARGLGHRWRARLLTPAVTVRLCLLQVLARVALAGLRHVAGVAASAQAVCKARARLPLSVWLALVERASAAAWGGGGAGAGGTFRGHRVVVADGTSFMTADTDDLARRHGKGGNGRRAVSAGYPVPKLLALADAATGVIRTVIGLPHHRQEHTCLARLFKLLSPGDLMLGDRGLVSFAHLALALAAGVHACCRLPRRLVVSGRGGGCRRRTRRLGERDLLVAWRKPPARCAWLSARRWAALPDALTLRQVAYRAHRPGYRPRWVWVVTTLTDPAAYPAADLAGLYGQRWRVETCFRDLKRTLGLGQVLRARTVAGARKEVACHVLLYNLVRLVMARAAAAQGVPADRVSFVDAARWLLWSAPGDPLPALVVNPARPGRPSQPRKLKRGRKKYPPLAGDRAAQTRPAAAVKC
jgi:hypothetical protein